MDREKNIDESWKDAVGQEKKSSAPEPDASEQDYEVNFLNYLTSLVVQAMIFLGEVPNPLEGEKTEINLRQAKLLIDTLLMLREKTKGNLAKEEENFLNMALYELEMKFVEHSQNPGDGPDGIEKKSTIIQP